METSTTSTTTTVAATSTSAGEGVAASVSWSESLGLESQQPGPSGFNIAQLSLPQQPQQQQQQASSGVGYGRTAVSTAGEQKSSEPVRTRSLLLDFRVPPSQDILRDSLSQESLGFGGGGSNLEAVETVTLVDNLLQLSQREREASAEQRMRESQELAQYLSQEHPQREATPPLLGGGVASDESDTSGEEEEEQVVGVADRIPAEISHAHNVPSIGGSESEDWNRRGGQEVEGVPELSPRAMVSQVIGGYDQVLPCTSTTTDSDVPVADLDQKQLSSQKVPCLSSRRLKQEERTIIGGATKTVQPSPLTTALQAPRPSLAAAICDDYDTFSSDDRQQVPQKLLAGPPVLGGGSCESSHEPATQTTSSSPSDPDIRVSHARSPLALQSPSPSQHSASAALEVVPSTLPSQSQELESCQDQDTSQEDLGNQVPVWCGEDLASVERRRSSRQDSFSSSSSDELAPPLPKRRREKSRSSSTSDVPRWQKDGSSDIQPGSGGQAQPSCVPPSVPVIGRVSHVPKLASQHSSGSSVQPSSSPHTGSSSMSTLSSSPSQSLRKNNSSLSDSFVLPSSSSLDRNSSSSSPGDNAGGAERKHVTQGGKQRLAALDPEAEVEAGGGDKTKEGEKECELEKATANLGAESVSLESLSSEIFRDSLLANSNTEEFVDVEMTGKENSDESTDMGVAERRCGLDLHSPGKYPPPAAVVGLVQLEDEEEGLQEDEEDQNSLTQLQDTLEYGEVVTSRKAPPLPLRSPAKIILQDSSWGEGSEVCQSQLSEMDVRNETLLRLRMSQSQSSEGITSGHLLAFGASQEDKEVGGAGNGKVDNGCEMHGELGREGGKEEVVAGDGGGGESIRAEDMRTTCEVCGGVIDGCGIVLCGGSRCVAVAGVGVVAEKSGGKACEEEEKVQRVGRGVSGGDGVPAADSEPSQQESHPIKPGYESLQFEDSTEDLVSDALPGKTQPLASHTEESQACPVSPRKPREEENIDIAQINSGSFQFQLPKDCLLEPLTSITPNPASSHSKTPPPEPASSSSSSSSAAAAAKLLQSVPVEGIRRGRSSEARGARIKSLSPSAVSRDFFTRSVTPSQQEGVGFTQDIPGKEQDHSVFREGVDSVSVGQLSEDLFASSTEVSKMEDENTSALAGKLQPEVSASILAAPLHSSSPRLLARSSKGETGKKDKVDCPVLFQLSHRGQEREEEMSVDFSSPPLLPQLNIPTDSQFELSADLDEADANLNRSTATTTESGGEREPPGKVSLFSDVVAARRQKVDLSCSRKPAKRKEQKDLQSCSEDRSQDLDMQVIMEKVRTSKRQRSQQNGGVEKSVMAIVPGSRISQIAAPISAVESGLLVNTSPGKTAPPGSLVNTSPSKATPPGSLVDTSPSKIAPPNYLAIASPGKTAPPDSVVRENIGRSVPPPSASSGVGSSPHVVAPASSTTLAGSGGTTTGTRNSPATTKSMTVPAIHRPASSTTHSVASCSRLSPGLANGRLSPGLAMARKQSPYSPLHSPVSSRHPVSPRPFPPGSEFVSPSRTISSEGFKELRRSVDEKEGQEVSAHELRYVHTMCTVIEERFISSETVADGVVVPGSEKFWPESSRPYTTQEIKVELLPRSDTSASLGTPHRHKHTLPSPSIVLSPFTRCYPSSSGHSYGQLKLHPSSSHPFPSISSTAVSQTGGTHPLPSPLSTSSHHPTAAPSASWVDHQGGGTNNSSEEEALKLNDAPSSRREKNNQGSTDAMEEENSKEANSNSPVSVTRDRSSLMNGSSSTLPEELATVLSGQLVKGGKTRGKGIAMATSRRRSAAVPMKTRRTSKSAFKVGMRLSLRSSPRKATWEESQSNFTCASKVGKGKKLSFGKNGSPQGAVSRVYNSRSNMDLSGETEIHPQVPAGINAPQLLPETNSKTTASSKQGESSPLALPARQVGGASSGRTRSSYKLASSVEARYSVEEYTTSNKTRTPQQKRSSPDKSRTTPQQKVYSPDKSRTPRQKVSSPDKSRTPQQEISAPGTSNTPRHVAVSSKTKSPQQKAISFNKRKPPKKEVAPSSRRKTPQLESPLPSTRSSARATSLTSLKSPHQGLLSPGTSVSSTSRTPTPRTRSSTHAGLGGSGRAMPTISPSAATSPETEGSPRAGDAVIARWAADKRWYAAIVRDKKIGRVTLDFADGERGTVVSSNLFSQKLLRRNEQVLACEDEERGLPEASGLFESFSQNGKQFTMRSAEGEKMTYSISCFAISSDTALEYVKLKKNSPGSRKRMTPRLLDQSPLTKRKKMSTSPGDWGEAAAEDEEFPIEEMLSPSQHCLFQGYTFFLTQKPKDDKQPGQREEPSVNKHDILALVTNRKGRVLETYKDEMITDGRYFVLSDDCCRTQKFLMGLALGIPVVSYTWITDCVQQGVVQDYSPYCLPAGIPHKRSVPIKWTQRERSSVLKGVQVYVHHHQPAFKEHWRQLLKYAGASVLSKLPTASRLKFEKVDLDLIVVTEEGCHSPASLSRCTGSFHITILGPEWVVQCLVQGKHLRCYQDFFVKLKP